MPLDITRRGFIGKIAASMLALLANKKFKSVRSQTVVDADVAAWLVDKGYMPPGRKIFVEFSGEPWDQRFGEIYHHAS
jgi:hypothetical protein